MSLDNKTKQTVDKLSSEMNSLGIDIADNLVEKLISVPEGTRFEIVTKEESYKRYYEHSRETRPYLTKFEKTKLIGVRAQQLASGSEAMVKLDGNESIVEIAEKELAQKKIPFIIRRYLPNQKHEDWRLSDMIN
tara:strand:+ start:77 stop:478 length:402 start_codon:yes stop_codon:yes gene_type:complete